MAESYKDRKRILLWPRLDKSGWELEPGKDLRIVSERCWAAGQCPPGGMKSLPMEQWEARYGDGMPPGVRLRPAECTGFREGRAFVRVQGCDSFICVDEELTCIDEFFEEVSHFKDGRACVKKWTGKYHYIDRDGKVLGGGWDALTEFRGPYCCVGERGADGTLRWGVLYGTGQLVLPPCMERPVDFSRRSGTLCVDGTELTLDMDEGIVVTPDDEVTPEAQAEDGERPGCLAPFPALASARFAPDGTLNQLTVPLARDGWLWDSGWRVGRGPEARELLTQSLKGLEAAGFILCGGTWLNRLPDKAAAMALCFSCLDRKRVTPLRAEYPNPSEFRDESVSFDLLAQTLLRDGETRFRIVASREIRFNGKDMLS